LERVEDQICIFVASQGDVSASDIIKQFSHISRRNIFRYLKKLRDNGGLKYGRIREKGKGKRARYSMPDEENSKNDMWIRGIPENVDRKNPRLINIKLTQKNFSKMISDEMKFYKKELKNAKKEPYGNFVAWHIAVASGCMQKILQLTWAINSGMFGDSNNKIKSAHRNRKRCEDFLNKIIYNLKKRDEKQFNSISAIIYNTLVHFPLIDHFYPETANYDLVRPPPIPLH